MSDTFASAIADCLAPGMATGELRQLVEVLLFDTPKAPPPEPEDLQRLQVIIRNASPARADIEAAQAIIRARLGEKADDRVALVYGGATKIKGYVFEAPKLPEIRGASALLDWVNEVALNELWYDTFVIEGADRTKLHPYIIYASGGGFLAFAPAELGEKMAAEVERCYTKHTLTANSVAVSKTFSLLELRYGRLNIQNDRVNYWRDEFLKHWEQPTLRAQLARYYYGSDDALPADRFYNRKTFGELVTLLTTMTNRRRDERAHAGQQRSVPIFSLIPWAEKCDSSGIRPAIVRTTVGDETVPREMSEASARKRAVGQSVKREGAKATRWFREAFKDWRIPERESLRSWEQKWEQHLRDFKDSPYAQAFERLSTSNEIKPPQDVGEIGQASSPRRYIGVIYADGNNVGRLVATLKTPRQYANVSRILSDTAQESVFQALAQYLQPVEVALAAKEQRARGTDKWTAWVHPFEILTIGGDDLFILVPGHAALDIAAAIGAYFEANITEKLRELEKLGELKLPKDARSISSYKQRFDAETTFSAHNYVPLLGLSAGVIIAQENAPIFFLRELVEELLKSAKGLAKENAKQGFFGGAVDFMVMKSITMVTDQIKSFRRQALGDDGKDSDRRLTARPYTWHEFAGLLETVRQLKKAHVPRSQLYRLRSALDAEPGNAITPSVMEYLYTRVRMQTGYSKALQQHIEQHWCWSTPVPRRTAGLPPWMPLGDKQGWETFWPDMLEAYEMVPEQIEGKP